MVGDVLLLVVMFLALVLSIFLVEFLVGLNKVFVEYIKRVLHGGKWRE